MQSPQVEESDGTIGVPQIKNSIVFELTGSCEQPLRIIREEDPPHPLPSLLHLVTPEVSPSLLPGGETSPAHSALEQGVSVGLEVEEIFLLSEQHLVSAEAEQAMSKRRTLLRIPRALE